MKTKLLLVLLLFPLTLSARKPQQLVLQSSTFQVLGYGGVSTGCAEVFCTASVPLVTPTSIVCPAPAGRTCTFAIDVQAFVRATPYDVGLLSYVGDGSYIDPRVNPYYTWQRPSNPSPIDVSASFTFVVTVKNTEANQQHPVEIDLVCEDENNDGCAAASAGWNQYFPGASVRIDVFRP